MSIQNIKTGITSRLSPRQYLHKAVAQECILAYILFGASPDLDNRQLNLEKKEFASCCLGSSTSPLPYWGKIPLPIEKYLHRAHRWKAGLRGVISSLLCADAHFTSLSASRFWMMCSCFCQTLMSSRAAYELVKLYALGFVTGVRAAALGVTHPTLL